MKVTKIKDKMILSKKARQLCRAFLIITMNFGVQVKNFLHSGLKMQFGKQLC